MALSTHPGGAADKSGLVHEALWGVRGLLFVLTGEAASIRIETPGDNGAEFNLLRGGTREHWQAKRQVTGQDTWSLQRLKSEGVLEFFFEKFRVRERCVFASVSDAPELRMLTENAAASQSLEEFQTHFLDKKRKNQFEELRRHLGANSDEETFAFLRTVMVHGGREITLEPEFGFRLSVMFQGPWQASMAVLRDLYLRSSHETLTAVKIEKCLLACGIGKRRAGAPDARDRILDVTCGYVAGQRNKLIRGTPIRRAIADDIMGKIKNSTASLDIFITSTAGGGKSACLCQIVEGLQAADVPVLAFRLDRIEPVSSAILLGERLGLGESPPLVLSEAFPGQSVVLVVDQLDCVSTVSGRHPDFFDTLSGLLHETLGLRPQKRIHVILACRKFDFEHDHRLKQLSTKDYPPIELGEFTAEEVKTVLRIEGGHFDKLTPQQQKMLRLPQNLSLFVDARLALTENCFTTSKELCDAYWLEKRKSVSAQRPEFSQHWHPAIQHLAAIMSERQELSVPTSAMDKFPPDFLEKMASEGVLTWDGKRYGFGHETFFDYCYARTLANGGRDFVAFLEADTQHLFRRAQLRQVLAFLRDDDFAAYLASLTNLLFSDRIRPHLKLLSVELLVAHPQARDEEMNVLMPMIESEMTCRREEKPNLDKIASRIWEWFCASRTLFVVADRMGLISKWLHTNEEWLQNSMVRYLNWQTDQHAERVAELLESFVGKAEWRTRLRFVMEGYNLEKSRRFFDLFLRLLAYGALDEAKDRLVSNGTFWSMLYGFAEKRPDWCAELAARWLDRQIAIANDTGNGSDGQRPILIDGFGVEDLFTSARGNPKVFLEHVLPAVLRAAKSFAYGEDEEEFSRDRLWPTRIKGEYIGMSEAFLGACETALELLCQNYPGTLHPFVVQLITPRLYTANHLLMSLYLSSPASFADEALGLLASEPKRLRCGYSDSPYWVAQQVIKKCTPHCSDGTFQKLEAVVLAFVSPYERSKEGLRWRGHAAYNLASALEPSRLSASAKMHMAEWKEKFKEPDDPPKGIRSYSVGSPIKEDSANHMTDKQWLGAIAKYDTDERRYDFDHPERGGALELARTLQKFTEAQPERFAHLALQFPGNAHPYYLSHVLRGLKGAVISSDLKLAVARRVFCLDHHDCIHSALDILGSISDAELPEDAIQFIHQASYHQDPTAELWDADKPYYGGDILTCGINSVRGYVAEAIRDLVFAHARYLPIFTPAIEKLVNDSSLAVRSCVASTLLAVAHHDVSLALRWSVSLLKADDRLLATAYVEELIRLGLFERFEHFAPTVRRMLDSQYDNVRESGGALACIARLYHEMAEFLSETALTKDVQCRLGACEVAENNLLHGSYRVWCEPTIQRLFVDECQEVRKKAAHCFWHLWQSPETPLSDFDSLIQAFLASPAFMDEPTFLLYALKETKHRLPEAVLDVCEAFIARCSEDARDIRTSRAADERTIGKLVFTAYAQLQSNTLQTRALDVIDRMNLEGLSSANTHLAEFDR